MGNAAFGGMVGAVACGILGFAVVALSGGGWSFLFELMGLVLGGLGGALAPLLAGADRTTPGRWPARFWGHAILWGIVASLAMALLGGGRSSGRDRATQAAAIAYVTLCGAIVPIVAWADRPRSGRRPARLRAGFLACGPLLLGGAVILWRFGSLVRKAADRSPAGPRASPSAAPPAASLSPTTWWDVMKGDLNAALAPPAKAVSEAFGGAVGLALGLALPMAFLAYGALLGGRAVRLTAPRAATQPVPADSACDPGLGRVT